MVRNGDLGLPVPDYVDENVSDKVVRIVQSYVGVVNKLVWRKGWGLPACSDIAERVLVRMGCHCIAIVDLGGWFGSTTAGRAGRGSSALPSRSCFLPIRTFLGTHWSV